MSYVIMPEMVKGGRVWPAKVLSRKGGVDYWVAPGREDCPATDYPPDVAAAMVAEMHDGQPYHRAQVSEVAP